MAHLRKVYSNRRPRGGTPGSATKTDATHTGRTPKDYSVQLRNHHGSGKVDEVMETLSKQIARKKKYG